MKRILIPALLSALFLESGYSQSSTKGPVFEVASITPCKPGTPEPPMEHAGIVQFTFPGGRFNASAATLKSLVEWAYGIQPAQHSGGPSWINTDRYDIRATAADNATDAQMKLMLRALLAERFQLTFHHEPRDLTVYVISAGKNAAKLTQPKDGEVHALRMAPQTGQDQKVASYRIIGTRYSVAELADVFARQLGRVILDRTGLKGEFDFTIDLTPDESHPNPIDEGMLLGALRDQIGLTVKSEKTPVDILTIDSAEKVVAGN
jgi:uncharacterized protein (TIGR03435 family)